VSKRHTVVLLTFILLSATLSNAQVERRVARTKNATESVQLSHQGRNRRYLLHVPDQPSGALVLGFHGGSETAENLEEISSLSDLSDREHFIVAYPQGIEKSWADGRGTTATDKMGIDDVGFAKAVVADIAKRHYVDYARIYATGASNGGIFSSRLGCDAADTFVAIAPVIGTIASAIMPNCKPGFVVSVIGVQGVADPVVPFSGGEVGGPLKGAAGGIVESSMATQELWRTLAGCSAKSSVTVLEKRVNDHTSVRKRAFSDCRRGAEVVWYEIEGGGHRWAPHHSGGVQEAVASKKLGVSSQNIDASEVIWAFFEAHPRKPERSGSSVSSVLTAETRTDSIETLPEVLRQHALNSDFRPGDRMTKGQSRGVQH
jgi:polyhydroxybutyrate depolymerase